VTEGLAVLYYDILSLSLSLSLSHSLTHSLTHSLSLSHSLSLCTHTHTHHIYIVREEKRAAGKGETFQLLSFLKKN
jgi:hypothetical protein